MSFPECTAATHEDKESHLGSEVKEKSEDYVWSGLAECSSGGRCNPGKDRKTGMGQGKEMGNRPVRS